uniref:Uncharacterized protein n=1 Tax=Panagrolaimus davidi TaxID=227884 RepID=A0A914P6Y6_9BILA
MTKSVAAKDNRDITLLANDCPPYATLDISLNSAVTFSITTTLGIVKVIAQHAKTSTASAVRDQAIMCLGNIVSDCDACRKDVMKTGVFETILDLLQIPTNLNAKQRDHYAWTLQNILRPSPTSPYLNVLLTQVTRKDV